MNQYLQAFNSFYEVIWIFIIYGFLGWCCEVAYATFREHRFINRGFLNGPICPIYGCGIVIVVSVLTPIKDDKLLLFIGSIALTTLLELVVGWGLETIFHNQWWNYTRYRFNFKGYICLRFSLIWGVACTLVMDIVYPVTIRIVRIVPRIPGNIAFSLFLLTFIADIIVTVSAVFKLNEKLRIMNEIELSLDRISNDIGENIHEGVTEALELSDKVKSDINELTEEFENRKEKLLQEKEELTRKYQELLNEKHFGHGRLLKAFPEMKNNKYSVSLDALKKAKGILPELHIKK